MSVPIAVVGWMPKSRIRSGVISDPPPMPVMPTSTPIPSPKTMIAGSILSFARLVIDFPDHFGQERECARIPEMPAKAKEFAVATALPSPGGSAAVDVSIRGLTHAYGEMTAIEDLDVEVPAHGV